jgi:hypothetical protein
MSESNAIEEETEKVSMCYFCDEEFTEDVCPLCEKDQPTPEELAQKQRCTSCSVLYCSCKDECPNCGEKNVNDMEEADDDPDYDPNLDPDFDPLSIG